MAKTSDQFSSSHFDHVQFVTHTCNHSNIHVKGQGTPKKISVPFFLSLNLNLWTFYSEHNI